MSRDPRPGPSSQSITLRDYQHDALAAIDAAFVRGVRRPLLVLPTGTGKTVIFAALVARRGGRALVLVHRDELLAQAHAKIRMAAPNLCVGVVKGERDDVSAATVIASVQTLSRLARLARLTGEFTTVVVDEAHHAAAESYGRILEAVGAFTATGPLVLGCTATPTRADGAPLGDIFEDIVYRKDLLEMIEQGYLAELRAIQVHLDVDLDDVHTRAGDLAPHELDLALRRANAPAHALEAYTRHAAGRKTLIFTPSVASAHEMAETFAAAGLTAEALDGSTPSDDRRAILHRLHTGATQIVANCAVLTEGFDEPSIACIIIARPTQSQGLYVQMIGRGTRLSPGKDECLIVDLVGNATRHELITAATLFNLTPTELAEQTVRAAVAARQAATHLHELHGQLVATTVDLFHRRSLHWIAADPTRYVLSCGDAGHLLLDSTDLDRWQVVLVDRARRKTILASGLDLAYAQGAAEDAARRLGAMRLVDRAAPWRRAPATEKQLALLRRWRVPIPLHCTKGEAADLLTAAVARCA